MRAGWILRFPRLGGLAILGVAVFPALTVILARRGEIGWAALTAAAAVVAFGGAFAFFRAIRSVRAPLRAAYEAAHPTPVPLTLPLALTAGMMLLATATLLISVVAVAGWITADNDWSTIIAVGGLEVLVLSIGALVISTWRLVRRGSRRPLWWLNVPAAIFVTAALAHSLASGPIGEYAFPVAAIALVLLVLNFIDSDPVTAGLRHQRLADARRKRT